MAVKDSEMFEKAQKMQKLSWVGDKGRVRLFMDVLKG